MPSTVIPELLPPFNLPHSVPVLELVAKRRYYEIKYVEFIKFKLPFAMVAMVKSVFLLGVSGEVSKGNFNQIVFEDNPG